MYSFLLYDILIIFPSFLAKLKAGKVHITSYDFPYFMYDPDSMDDDDIRAGLCRGFLLIRVSPFSI
jgi:hypothetical protein